MPHMDVTGSCQLRLFPSQPLVVFLFAPHLVEVLNSIASKDRHQSIYLVAFVPNRIESFPEIIKHQELHVYS